jgi:hypothetical protein
MKKMLSLAAMLAVISYASPASAELKISGDAATRVRGQFNNSLMGSTKTTDKDDIKFQYRVRLKASADLGDGYFFKTLIANEETGNGGTPGWSTVGATNTEKFQLEVSNFYFGRVMESSHYQIGRLPLNSFNNPIFDVTLYPVPTAFDNATGIFAVDVPVFQWNYDRVYGMNYGTKVGNGDLNATLVVLDNNSTIENSTATGDGVFNDGYLLHLSYKTNIGDVTFEPQAIITLTDAQGASYQKISPNTFGANATIPVGKSKIGLSGFYTVCQDNKGSRSVTSTVAGDNTATPVVETSYTVTTPTATSVDYSGYLLRVKGESGPVMAWVDYNRTVDKSLATDYTYNNIFVWAQYKVNVHESALGTVSLTPTVRYRASGREIAGTPGTDHQNQLRTELWASVTF